MRDFARRAASDRAAFFSEAAATRGVPAWMFEKDFWVCWLLQEIFQLEALRHHLVFKGGTSLSKVYGVIQRFSEDIDLSVSPEYLGFSEAYLSESLGSNRRKARNEELENACIHAVEARLQPILLEAITRELGPAGTTGWDLIFRVDEVTHSPVLLFQYPVGSGYGTYVRPEVKVELGSLTDQRPAGDHVVEPMLTREYPDLFKAAKARVVALEIERTFWEKATILHAQYHRAADNPIPDRYSRHYSDMAALILHDSGQRSEANIELLARVVKHKSIFFASGWANYASALPGTLRLVPPAYRLTRLAADYKQMQDMFLEAPPSFESVIATLKNMEERFNAPR